ncbi:MAG: TetR family transcriptional regulator C-terminal domain-containing protein [Corallococcus sp.]|nr:TetR family transcriptional regulator C-terminal domain-containing protein [Corallococcus sp.]MCM1359937.1 TetR family transcriptional regulator C-terminal domain-containing protein [Corallococcus sp.]MCM1395493.1 TetR family transcriptional regulator C-terminal domain-containing protein [Corallococcus sp.]
MTKRCLKDALLECLSYDPLSKINVTNLCKIADVNRSTFYSYYNNVSELLCEIENEVLEQIPRNTQAEYVNYDDKFLTDLEMFFDYVKRNDKTFRILMLQANGEEFNQKLLSFVYNHYKNSILVKDKLLAKYCSVYCINGIVGMTKEWIRDNYPMGSKQFADQVFQMSIQASDIE